MRGPKQLLEHQITYHQHASKCHKALGEAHRIFAKTSESHMDQRAHLSAAQLYDSLASNDQTHVARLSELRNGAPDRWALAESNIDSDGQSTKMMTKAFFDDIFYARPAGQLKDADYDKML